MPTSKSILKPTHEVVLDDLDRLFWNSPDARLSGKRLSSILQRSSIPTDDLPGMIARLEKLVVVPHSEPLLRSLLQRLKREYADHIR